MENSTNIFLKSMEQRGKLKRQSNQVRPAKRWTIERCAQVNWQEQKACQADTECIQILISDLWTDCEWSSWGGWDRIFEKSCEAAAVSHGHPHQDWWSLWQCVVEFMARNQVNIERMLNDMGPEVALLLQWSVLVCCDWSICLASFFIVAAVLGNSMGILTCRCR